MTSKSGFIGAIRNILGAQRPCRRANRLPSKCRTSFESLEVRQLLVAPILLSSRPGAPVTVFLDVDGHIETDQGWINFRGDNQTGPIDTPAFDLDGDPTTFNAAETQWVEEIWYRVAEDYAPLDINVTTVDPGTINDFEAVRVVIGGDGSWSPALPGGGRAGGYGTYGFNSGASNTSFVFSEVFFSAAHIASASSHESGHTFGLGHHSTWNADGSKNQEYNPGNANRAPLMGVGYSAARDVWDNGPGSSAANINQDDLAVLTSAANRTIQFRPDDFGGTTATADDLFVTSPNVTQSGLIERDTDVDFFKFETDSGNISFQAEGLNLRRVFNNNRLTFGTNLDIELRLYDSTGAVIATAAPGNSLFASLTATVQRGTYYVGVSGTGEYGALGQYTLTGNVIPLPSIPTLTAPTGTINSLRPDFRWTQGANAASYELEVDNLTTNTSRYYTASVTTTSNTPTTDFVEGTYQARVRTIATNGTTSAWSNVLSFTVSIPTPAAPTLIRPKGLIGDSYPTFEWTSVAFATRYDLWVTNTATNQRVIYRTNYRPTTYEHFSALKDGTYRVNVRAGNLLNRYGAWSQTVTIRIKAPTPVAPVLTAPLGVTTSTRPRFTWNAVEGAARYDLRVSNLSTGKVEFIRESNLPRTQTFFDPPYMTQGNYVAYIRTFNGNDRASAWSARYEFTVDVLPPNAPSMTGPRGANDSPTISTINPTFTWTKAPRAVRYELLVNNLTTRTAGVIQVKDLKSTSYTSLMNLPQANYRAWARGINGAGEVGDWSAPLEFTIDEPTPNVPTITAPASNTLGYVENSNPTFVWEVSPESPTYDFYLYNASLKQSAIFTRGITTTQYRIPTENRLGEYVYSARVRSVNVSGDVSNWSRYFTIRVNVPDPTTPILIGPGGTITDNTPLFSWVHTATSFSYELLVRDLVNGEDITLQVKSFQLSPDGNQASYSLPDSMALAPSTYRFWVRAFNSQGQASSWSNSKTFVLSAQLDKQLLPIGEDFAASELLIALLPGNEVSAEANQRMQASVDKQTPTEETVVSGETSSQEAVVIISSDSSDKGSLAMIDAVMRRMADPADDIDFFEVLA